MSRINIRTRVLAGTPIETGERRFLPSVLMTTIEGKKPDQTDFYSARIRPISVVEQGPEGHRWHAIPNTTNNALSVMAAVGLGFALACSSLILLVRLGRR